jgi:Stress responsive A/B Barrel Domain
MIAHTVLMKPRPDLTPVERRAFVDALAAAVRDIPTVRGFRVGRRVRLGAGYEERSPDAADFMAIIDFDDVAGLEAYLRHPAHVALGARFSQSLSSALVYDFEVGGEEFLDELA